MDYTFKFIIAESLKHDFLGFEQFRTVFKTGYAKCQKETEERIEKMAKKYGDDAYDFYADDWSEISDTNILFTEVAIIALYMDIEKIMKMIVENIFDMNPRKCFKIKEMIKAYRVKKIDLTAIKTFGIVDELRELNNCIKHSGYVSKALQKYDKKRWMFKEVIQITESDMDKYNMGCDSFKNELYIKIIKYIKSLP